MNQMSTGQKIGVGGAALLLIASFLPWYSAGGFSIKAWDSGFLAWGGVVLGVAAGAVLLLKALGTKDVQAGGMASEQIAVALGVASFILVVLRFITESSFSSYGLYLGIVAAAATAYGAFTEMKARGMTMNDMKERFSGGSSTGTGTGAPPPA